MDSNRQRDLRLTIRVRHIYSAEGKVIGRANVFAPERGSAVRVGDEVDSESARSLEVYLAGSGDLSSSFGDDQSRSPLIRSERVGLAMTPHVVRLSPDDRVEEAFEVLSRAAVDAAPVFGVDGMLCGVVRRVALEKAKAVDRESTRSSSSAETVGDLMSATDFVVRDTLGLAQAAGLMVVEGVLAVLVVSPRGELVGILTAFDVMRWIAERDGYLTGSTESNRSPAE